MLRIHGRYSHHRLRLSPMSVQYRRWKNTHKEAVQGARTKFIARHSGRESRLRVFMLLMTTSVSEGVPNKFEKVGTFGLCEEYQFF